MFLFFFILKILNHFQKFQVGVNYYSCLIFEEAHANIDV